VMTIRGDGITLDRFIMRRFRKYLPGYLERVLDVNPGLAGCGGVLPVGTKFILPTPLEEETTAAILVIKLWD